MPIERPSPARPEDAGTVISLLAAQLDEHAIPLARELLARSVTAALADDSRALILVAREGGHSVGVAFVSFQSSLERGGRIAWLEELYVLPDRRGAGIGSRLVQATLDVARERGCMSVELEVESSHARAAHLYRRAGFRPLERVHYALPLA